METSYRYGWHASLEVFHGRVSTLKMGHNWGQQKVILKVSIEDATACRYFGGTRHEIYCNNESNTLCSYDLCSLPVQWSQWRAGINVLLILMWYNVVDRHSTGLQGLLQPIFGHLTSLIWILLHLHCTLIYICAICCENENQNYSTSRILGLSWKVLICKTFNLSTRKPIGCHVHVGYYGIPV